MKTFTDYAGRTWTVTINVDAIKRVKALTEVNLLEAVEGKLLERLWGDPVLLCDVLYALCKPEADAQGVTDEQFGQGMAGDAIDLATAALLEELVDFFPKQKRAVLQKLLTKFHRLQTLTFESASRELESDKIDQLLEAELQKLSDSFGNWPGSSVSTPDHSPSGN